MSLVELIPIIAVLLVVGTGVWVYTDARTQAEEGDPVTLAIGSIQLDSPEVWTVACVILWVLAFPAYLATRSHPT
jgi:hypothetical protein